MAMVTPLFERLTTSNIELRQIITDIKYTADGYLVAESTDTVEYGGEVARVIALLGSNASTLP